MLHPGERVLFSVADEIEEFQRQDILKSLRVGPYDDDEEQEPRESINSAGPSPGSRAPDLQNAAEFASKSAKLNVPVRRLDALDMAKYLAEVRTRQGSKTSLQLKVTHNSRYMHSPLNFRKVDNERRKSSTGLLPLSDTERTHLQKYWFIYAISIFALVGLLLGISCWVYATNIAANLSSISIIWHHVEIGNMTQGAFNLAMRGTLSNSGATRAQIQSGSLRMTHNGTIFGELIMPSILTSAHGTELEVRQSVAVKDSDALSSWLAEVAEETSPTLLLDGVLEAYKVFRIYSAMRSRLTAGIRVKFDPLNTTLPTLANRLVLVGPIQMTFGDQPDKSSRSVSTTLKLSSTSFYDIVLPGLSFEMRHNSEVCTTLDLSSSSALYFGDLVWQLHGSLPLDRCRVLQEELKKPNSSPSVSLSVTRGLDKDRELAYVNALTHAWQWTATVSSAI